GDQDAGPSPHATLPPRGDVGAGAVQPAGHAPPQPGAPHLLLPVLAGLHGGVLPGDDPAVLPLPHHAVRGGGGGDQDAVGNPLPARGLADLRAHPGHPPVQQLRGALAGARQGPGADGQRQRERGDDHRRPPAVRGDPRLPVRAHAGRPRPRRRRRAGRRGGAGRGGDGRADRNPAGDRVRGARASHGAPGGAGGRPCL
ncbi:MAG: transmembrane protein, distant homology with ydbT, partial [uncultured Gemmatimonadetes bacterium]